MSGLDLAFWACGGLLVAIFLRVPIAVAMAGAGFAGSWALLGTPWAVLNQLKTLSYDTFSSYSLSIVPMFLLMGQFASRSGLSGAMFQAASDWIGHRRGGVAMAAVGACAGFGAICGSSLATASTMGQVALPEMRARGYGDGLATGALAAGGTLGILIPPSIILVIYAILTEQNVATMFQAAVVPGILAVIGYLIVVAIYVRVKPESAPQVPRKSWAQRWRSLIGVAPAVGIFTLVIGGIAADWHWAKPGVQALFTPTEGAAVGAIATGLHGLLTRGLDARAMRDAIYETAQASAMIFLILLGATIFSSFLAFSQAPQALADWVVGQGFAPFTVLAAILVIYLVMGCVMDSLSMILLTVPIFFPILQGLDFGLTPDQLAIWFGVIALIVVEVGLITPPVGMNLFIINQVASDIPITRTYAGVAPFVISDLIRVVLLVLFPALVLALGT